MKKHAIRFCFLSLVLLLVAIDGKAQASSKNELPRGVVIDKVVCLDDNTQSYALYLPTNYSPEKKWAVLYAFDPSARGKFAVQIFRDAAEKFGFIVVGSNDSQNGLNGQKLSQIIDAFWKDTHARLSVDEKRTYTAGFSGGAKVANSFAFSCGGGVAGVISSGAAFPSNFPLDKKLPYVVFGTVGTGDFNYPEMIDFDKSLNENSTSHRLAVFDGRHQWLTKDLTFEALEWLKLQAMKAGRMNHDAKFAEEFYAEETTKAQTLLQKGEILEAARLFEAVIKDFKDIQDTKEIAAKLSEIRRQKEYAAALSQEKKIIDRQTEITQKIISMGVNLADLAARGETLHNLSDELKSWREKAAAAEDSGERRLARRVLAKVFAQTFEAATLMYQPRKDYKAMIVNFELARLVYPQLANISLDLARAYALDKQKKNALDAIDEAIKNGFSDCGRFEEKQAWENLRGEKRFQEIIERLKCKNS